MTAVRFRPTRTFEEEPTGVKSVYLEGQIYTVQDGNDVLAAFVREWERKRMVTVLSDDKGTRPAIVRGRLET